MKKGLVILLIFIFYFICINDADGGTSTKNPASQKKPPSGAANKPTSATKKPSNITTKATNKNNSKFTKYKVIY